MGKTWTCLAFLALAAILPAAAAPETFEVALWANDERPARRPGVIGVDAHPCGAVAIVRLTEMPPHRGDSRTGLDSELVVETGADGREAARWSVPVDYEPIAIRGAELLIAHGGRRLWIGTGGGIRSEPADRAYPPLVPMQCPAVGAHSDSAYALCAATTDAGDGRRRMIRYEASCT